MAFLTVLRHLHLYPTVERAILSSQGLGCKEKRESNQCQAGQLNRQVLLSRLGRSNTKSPTHPVPFRDSNEYFHSYSSDTAHKAVRDLLRTVLINTKAAKCMQPSQLTCRQQRSRNALWLFLLFQMMHQRRFVNVESSESAPGGDQTLATHPAGRTALPFAAAPQMQMSWPSTARPSLHSPLRLGPPLSTQ